MNINSSFNNKILSNKLKVYFKNNIKISLKTTEKVFIITNNDVFYEIDIYEEEIPQFISTNDNSVIEKTIVEELSHKTIFDLTYGLRHYIARTNDNNYYCWGNDYWGQLANGKRDNGIDVFNKPELNLFLSDLNFDIIKCGAYHSLALTQNGEVYAWGSNVDGQLGIESESDSQLTPVKVNGFDEETVIMISCGYSHSMALTENKRVFTWGDNRREQLGIDDIKDINTARPIQLDNVLIDKISCGHSHNLLLSDEGVIYAFGYNRCGQIGIGTKETQRKPTKLIHEKKFIDIMSHWNENISMALSIDNIYYIWGDCKTENFLTPKETTFISFEEIFVHYFGYNTESTEELIDFKDLVFRNGYYDKRYKELKELGEGSYGKVWKATDNEDPVEFYAIKKLRFENEYERGIRRELNNFTVINKLLENYVVEHYEAWLETSEKELQLYFRMELCDTTLENIMYEMEKDSNFKVDGILTPIGYYIASQLFIEILECVQHLHKHNIIHRDLKPDNIMLKWNRHNKRFIKICDFGLIAVHTFTKQLHSSTQGQTKYMAPEVDSKIYDIKADIYSLGVIFQKLLDVYYDE
jgi:alpha-tubulin suppressor-like RCC1 family protein